jgi:hypothetical protein
MGAWIFLGLVTIPQLFIVLLLGLQVFVRYRLEERFEQQTTVHVVVEERDLVWVKPGREILVKGEMFDIKSIRYEGGKAYITRRDRDHAPVEGSGKSSQERPDPGTIICMAIAVCSNRRPS